MALLEKLCGILMANRTLYNTLLVEDLLWGIFIFILLAVVAGVLIGGLLIGSFYAVYLALIHYGLEPNAALIALGGLAVILFSVLGMCLCSRVDRLQNRFQHCLSFQSLVPSGLLAVIESFVEGLREGKR